MADNAVITPGTGKTVLADEVVDGVLGTGIAQFVKIYDGTLDSANKLIVNSAGEAASYGPDTVASGTITVNDTVVAAPAGTGAFVSGASSAGSLVACACNGSESVFTVQITGLTSGTLYFEVSLDSTNGTDGNWLGANARQLGLGANTLAVSTTTNGMFRGIVAGMKWFRIRSKATLTGTPAILIRLSDGDGGIDLISSLPNGANAIGSVTVAAGAAAIGSVTLGAAANVIGAVSLGTSTGKTIKSANGTLASSATTADQVIATYTVTAGKTLYICEFDVMAWLTTPAATFTSFGLVSLELPSGTKIWTQMLQGPGVDRFAIEIPESLFVAAATVVRLVVTPISATAMTFRGNIIGTEK